MFNVRKYILAMCFSHLADWLFSAIMVAQGYMVSENCQHLNFTRLES